MANIGSRAGVSQENIYVNFKNKEDLLKTMIPERRLSRGSSPLDVNSGRDESVRRAFLAGDRTMREALAGLLEKNGRGRGNRQSLDVDEVLIRLYALVGGLIARTAGAADFAFDNHLNTF